MELSQEQIKRLKKEAKRLDGVFFSIDEAIVAIEHARLNNENVYIDFNGRIFYSLFDDETSCYKRVSGVRKEKQDEGLEQNQPGNY